jgi:PST family polysaccharide transporter
MLSDGGMGNALVRVPSPSREIESTVFWLSVLVGGGLVLVTCLLAWPAAAVLHQPGFTPILQAMSPILLLSSMLSVANSRISRERRFGVFAAGDLISALLSSAAAILAALHGWGAWSLVAQQLVLWVAKAAWILPSSGFLPRPYCRPSRARELLAFGLHNVGAQVADYAGKAVPPLLIGATLGVVAVGHYSMAYQLVRIPDLVLSGPLYLATFTSLCALSADRRAEAAALSMRTLRMVILIIAPIYCGLALVADLMVAALLGAKWAAAAAVLTMLAGAGFFICLYSLLGAILMGLGRSDLQFRLSILCGGAMSVGALIGRHFGLEFAALGVSLGMAVSFPFYLWVLGRQLGADTAQLLAGIGAPLIATGVMALVLLAIRHLLPGLPPMLLLAGCISAGVASFALALAFTARQQIVDDVAVMMASRRPGASA